MKKSPSAARPRGKVLGVLPLIYLDDHELHLRRETEDSNPGPP